MGKTSCEGTNTFDRNKENHVPTLSPRNDGLEMIPLVSQALQACLSLRLQISLLCEKWMVHSISLILWFSLLFLVICILSDKAHPLPINIKKMQAAWGEVIVGAAASGSLVLCSHAAS